MSTLEDTLRTVSFGQRVAEQEADALKAYFVQTDQWRRIIAGEVDIIFGPKGAGKSAIYSLLVQSEETLLRQRTLVRAGEKPQGLPAFSDVVLDPPNSEAEWRALWTAYFLCLVADTLADEQIAVPEALRVRRALADLKLIPHDRTVDGFLRTARAYAKGARGIESVETGVTVNPETSGLGATGKVTFRDPEEQSALRAALAVGQLLTDANAALDEAGLDLWIALDRLDVAFADEPATERDALRALLRVYLDLLATPRITPKIFLRTDIWSQVTESGFREASHIVRTETIDWTRDSLLDLIMRRALDNVSLLEQYEVDRESVLSSVEERERLFYRIFPDQVEGGQNQIPTLEWIISRTRDGRGRTAPREVIHLCSTLREKQLQRIEVGHAEPDGERLFERATFRAALDVVSHTRLEQTLYAESPKLKRFVQALESGPTSFELDELESVWKVPQDEARSIADALVDVAFFEQPTATRTAYHVPFLYRPALKLGQRNGA